MLSVFLSGCQRQVITGVSKNENDVSTSTNTPTPWDNDDDDTWWDGHKFTEATKNLLRPWDD
ncbi:hypothetical protein [Candidatus Endomicrobiellum trichonymphae]|uniref:hypothetical protein n=1 Tax=Endomicrobium trichonymphae TaxID=1408204 RepID=UPI0039B91153